MSRIRVLQIVPGIAIGDLSGGAEQYAIQVNRLLPQDEFEPAVFVMTRLGSPSEDIWCSKLISEGIIVSGFIPPDQSLIRFVYKVFISLWNFVSSFHPDIIISHTERGDLLNSAIHLLHPIHPKSVRTIHIDKQWISHPTVGNILNQIIFPLTFNTEIAVSETIQHQQNNRKIARLLHKVTGLYHNGIDQSYFDSPPRTRKNHPIPKGIPDVHPNIGIIGRLTDQKGHINLFQAIKIVSKDQLIHLLVVGSGPLEQNLSQLSRNMGIEEYIHFLGSRNDVLDIIPFVDVVVSASYWEGFPTVVLEAMSQSVPVIATDISGSCDLIQSGISGILVPPGDSQALADAIITMLEDPDRAKRMGRTARTYASQFTIQNTAKSHAELYKSLVK